MQLDETVSLEPTCDKPARVPAKHRHGPALETKITQSRAHASLGLAAMSEAWTRDKDDR